jgi:four helix bundle protein
MEWGRNGVGESWSFGMKQPYRNKNRGYQQLLVWQDAVELYGMTCRLVKDWRFEYKKVASQAISSADSVHRNIAEGYCRRTVKEYLQHLNIAIGSLGESMSGFVVYHRADQISTADFDSLDTLVFRLENRLLRLVEALERKRDDGTWDESMTLREPLTEYTPDTDSPDSETPDPDITNLLTNLAP